MRSAVLAVAVIAGGAVMVSARAPQQTPRSSQVFRGSTDAVTVDVAVRRGGTPIEGLGASDFQVLDNGVPQRIESIDSTDATTLPVDVTILVDTNDEVADEADGINKQVARIASMLRPIDRLRVWRLNPWIEETRPLTTLGARASVPVAPAGGLAAVNDAIGAALMEPVAPDARHLVIAITNGIDTESVLRLDAVKALAERTSATLHVAQIDVVEPDPGVWISSAEHLRAFACHNAFRCQPTHMFFQPHYTPVGKDRFDPLAAIADETGGKLHTLGLFVEHNAFDVFANAFKDYQQNYVLRYVPEGVPRPGWHAIEVTLPAHSGYTIHARRGYAIEGDNHAVAAASGATSAPPPAPAPADSAATVVQAYERGDYAAAEAIGRDPSAFGDAIRGLRARGNLWPAAPRREAVLALDLAAAAFRDPATDVAREAGLWLGDEYRWLRSPLGPDAFEHDWLVAELALLEGLQQPGVAQPLVDIARQRFPGDAWIRLADATFAEQAWTAAGSPNAGVTALLGKYDDAAAQAPASADVTAESAVRGAWVLHLANRDPEALDRLATNDDAGADPDVRYLRLLVRGRVLLAQGRTADAVDAGRAAVAMRPNAKSAHELLEQAWLTAGNANAARADTLAAPAFDDAADPWSGYARGGFRRFPALLARLRASVR